MMSRMNWSWAATEEAIAGRRAQSAGLVGARLSSVRYILLDYTQPDRAGDSQGPRLVDSPAELFIPGGHDERFSEDLPRRPHARRVCAAGSGGACAAALIK